MRVFKSFLFCLFLLMFSYLCYADGIAPITHVFNKDTSLMTIILLLIIILIEAGILKAFIRKIKFKKHLLFSLIINIVSSAVGSLFFINRPMMSWNIFFPLFIITVIVEFPVIKLLYRKLISWPKALLVNFVINIASYISVFLVQILLVFGFFFFGGIIDKNIEKNWTHAEILKGEKGDIYAIDNLTGGKLYQLQRFNMESGSWDTLGGQYFKSYPWDLSNNILACITNQINKQKGIISLFKLPDFSSVSRISGDFKNLQNIRVSPTGKYLARIADWKFLDIGGIGSKLYIYSIRTGKKVSQYNHVYGDHVSWSPDSKKVMFTGLDENGKVYIYTYSFLNNKLKKIYQGYEPEWGPYGEKILFRKGRFGNNLYVYSIPKDQEKLLVKRIFGADYRWSPTGKNIIASVPYTKPLPERKRLVIISFENLDLRFIINQNIRNGFVWTDK